MFKFIKNVANRLTMTDDEYGINARVTKTAKRICFNQMKEYFETIYPSLSDYQIRKMAISEVENLDNEEVRRLASIAVLQFEEV